MMAHTAQCLQPTRPPPPLVHNFVIINPLVTSTTAMDFIRDHASTPPLTVVRPTVPFVRRLLASPTDRAQHSATQLYVAPDLQDA